MTDPDFHACAAAGVSALQRWYDPSTGLWKGLGWWNAANALTAVIGYTKLTGDSSHAGVIGTTFTAAQRQRANFVNSYYDDNGWWALAWVAAYDVTRDSRYLGAARTIFARNVAGWDDTCRGGLWWNETKTYKNAITNELFLTLAARLHQRTPGDHGSYLTWALREWEWFSSAGLIGASGLVNDGLTSACQNNGQTTWTYNQGVILGGLATLFEITGDHAYLTQGEAIADAALSKLTTPPSAAIPGILAEPCEATAAGCNGDQTQFKGIFVRHLYDFWLQSRQPAYRAFILSNARSIWDHNQNADHEFGLRWTGPFDRADAARQSSALDALNAAVALAPAQLGRSPSTVHVAVFDPLADWEIGYATAHIRRHQWQREPGQYSITTVGPTHAPVTTMGGLRITPVIAVGELRPQDGAMLILAGGDRWAEEPMACFRVAARRFLAAGVPVAAVCGATFGLAMEGLLDDRAHTSNAAEYLAYSGYGGGDRFVAEPAVVDGDLITASGVAPVHFARAIFERLGLYAPTAAASWFKLYGDRDPAGFFELMSA